MGLLSRYRQVAATAPSTGIVTAADTFYGANTNTIWTLDLTTVSVTRAEAMTVPAVARARNIICSTIGTLPLERYEFDGTHLPTIPLLAQPDFASPRSVTWTWLADSVFFYGVGYMQVTGVYSEDSRPAGLRWIDPLRVQPVLNNNQTMVVGYELDGGRVPETGVGSLIAFNGPDEGLLRRAGRTLKTAIELENAAYRAAQEPAPQTVLKNSGMDMPSEKVTGLLTAWKQARQTRATAYLAPGLELQMVGFDPKSQQLVEARQFHASEIARACSIPAWYLNAEMASMTYSNTETERRNLIDFSLRQLMTAIEDRLSMFDITPRGVYVRFDLDDFLRGSMKERAEISTMLLDAGIINQAEARDLMDIEQEDDSASDV